MPKGDPAGYLPAVKKARKKKGGKKKGRGVAKARSEFVDIVTKRK